MADGVTVKDIMDLAKEMPTRVSIDWSKTSLNEDDVYHHMILSIRDMIKDSNNTEKLIILYAALVQKTVEDYVQEFDSTLVEVRSDIKESVEEELEGQLEPRITDFDYLTSTLGNAYFSNLTFEDLWDAVEMSEDREQLDAAIWAAIELKELHDK